MTMVDALEKLRQKGYRHSLEITGDSLLRADNGALIEPAQATIVDTYRFEGESDPDDMAVVYAVEAVARDGSELKGVLVETFGAYAEPEYARVAECLKKRM